MLYQFVKIPITFEWQGRSYRGTLDPVRGMGTYGHHWHLVIGSMYCGLLSFTSAFGWKFTANDRRFEDLADYFADYIVAYIG